MAAEPAYTPTIAAVASRAPARSVDRKRLIRRGRAQHLVLTSMFLAIGAVTGLAWLDSRREADAVLGDVASEQAVIASLLAANLRARLAHVERDEHLVAERGPDGRIVDLGMTAAELLDASSQVERPGELRIFLAPPEETALYPIDGRILSSSLSTAGLDHLRDALDRNVSTVRLGRSEAADIGLKARTAVASLVHVDTATFGRWGVVVVGSAARLRDREARAFWRLVLGVGLASSLVLAFGGVALRKQRKEFELAHKLTVSELEHERDEQLLRAARVATMGTFAMGVAHEVSTPLGVIVGRAEQLLARAPGDERASRAAQAILKQADHIQHIVRRFLDMARGGPPSFARTDPSAVLRAVLSAVEHRFAKANVSLVSDVPESMPFIQCDRDLLEHAIVNLLLNACEASATGGHVELAARCDADRVAFIVTDDGVGISAEDAARAAEPFFTTKPAGIGTGLGLAIAAEIAKCHRGNLTIAPNAERGTRACIEIPIAPENGSEVGGKGPHELS
jgi:two-component system NtrC family sensor kinase